MAGFFSGRRESLWAGGWPGRSPGRRERLPTPRRPRSERGDPRAAGAAGGAWEGGAGAAGGPAQASPPLFPAHPRPRGAARWRGRGRAVRSVPRRPAPPPRARFDVRPAAAGRPSKRRDRERRRPAARPQTESDLPRGRDAPYGWCPLALRTHPPAQSGAGTPRPRMGPGAAGRHTPRRRRVPARGRGRRGGGGGGPGDVLGGRGGPGAAAPAPGRPRGRASEKAEVLLAQVPGTGSFPPSQNADALEGVSQVKTPRSREPLGQSLKVLGRAYAV